MKRPLFLAGTIISIVICSILSFSTLITFFEALKYVEILGGAYIFGLVLAIVISVLALIFNIDSISVWKQTKSKFKKQKGYIITAIVFNFILVGLYLCSFLIGLANILTFLIFASILIGTIFMLVDFCREKNKKENATQQENDLNNISVCNSNKEEVEEQEDFFAGETIKEIKAKQEKIKKEQKENTLLTLESKLIKLNEMKEKGLIDQDEYNELKKSYIKEEIKK